MFMQHNVRAVRQQHQKHIRCKQAGWLGLACSFSMFPMIYLHNVHAVHAAHAVHATHAVPFRDRPSATELLKHPFVALVPRAESKRRLSQPDNNLAR